MITKLSVRNFQSHSDTVLDFAPGINVIVGSSDAGKSALLRAIKWLVFNRPLGTSIIRQGTEECDVELQTSNGIVKKHKGKDSYYEINAEIFRAFGNSVPDTISSVINISDINCLGQFDGYYLVFESSGEIAKELNKALNIDLIDKCISSCNSSIRTHNTVIVLKTKERDALIVELDKYKDLEKLEKEINLYLEKETRLTTCNDSLVKLEKLLVDIVKTKVSLQKASYDNLAINKDLIEITELVENYRNKYDRYNKLKAICKEVSNIKQNISSAQTNLDKTVTDINFKKTKYKEVINQFDVCPFCNRKMTQTVCEHLTRRLG